jgi:hypothetical protein
MAATPVRETSTRPSGRIRSMNWLILAELPVISNTKLSTVASITRAKRLGQPQRLDAVLAGAAQFHHRQFALDRAAGQRHVDDAVDRDHAVELVFDLLDHHRRARGDDGDARECFWLSVSETVRLSML